MESELDGRTYFASPNLETRPVAPSYSTGHCHDAEKCNADTFCDCPCMVCMRTKRGEFQTR